MVRTWPQPCRSDYPNRLPRFSWAALEASELRASSSWAAITAVGCDRWATITRKRSSWINRALTQTHDAYSTDRPAPEWPEGVRPFQALKRDQQPAPIACRMLVTRWTHTEKSSRTGREKQAQRIMQSKRVALTNLALTVRGEALECGVARRADTAGTGDQQPRRAGTAPSPGSHVSSVSNSGSGAYWSSWWRQSTLSRSDDKRQAPSSRPEARDFRLQALSSVR